MQLGKTGGFLESVTDCEWLQQPLLITRQLLGSQIREGFRFKSYNQVNIDERVSSTTRLCDSVQLVLLPYESEGSEHLSCNNYVTISGGISESQLYEVLAGCNTCNIVQLRCSNSLSYHTQTASNCHFEPQPTSLHTVTITLAALRCPNPAVTLNPCFSMCDGTDQKQQVN